jgi:KDO2-lipid IV(A) lauroyltransferase
MSFCLRRLPLAQASQLMGWCWRVVAPHLHRHPRALAHLALAYPEKSEAEREAIALGMWDNLGRVFAESLMVDRLVAAGSVDDRVSPVLERRHTPQAGIVFVSLHAGNWELAIVPARAAGIKIAGVYQKIKNPMVDAYVIRARRDHYPRGLFEKGPQAARRLMRIVREGGAIAMLADLRDRRGVVVPFFGQLAPSTSFPALLARSCGAVLVAVRVVRTGPVRFTVEGEVVEIPRNGDRDHDVEEGTRRIQALFEKWVREHPEQWMWAHRRWG